MLKVLTQFGRAGDHLPLSDPLLQLVDLPVELVEPVLLLQSALPLLHQVLQRHVQTIDLRLALADLLAVEREECVRGNIKTCYITSTPYSDRPSACNKKNLQKCLLVNFGISLLNYIFFLLWL